MAEGRERCHWNHTSHVLAWIQNWAMNGGDYRPVSPRTLNPFGGGGADEEERPEQTISGVDLAVMWCGQAALDYFAGLDRQNDVRR